MSPSKRSDVETRRQRNSAFVASLGELEFIAKYARLPNLMNWAIGRTLRDERSRMFQMVRARHRVLAAFARRGEKSPSTG
jgi:hypothetical protein